MKVLKINLGKTVENGKLQFTPNCRKQKSDLGKNVENRLFTLKKFLLVKK
jgi:hypothetical protein